MTLDPVHFDGIVAMARSIGRDVDERDHRAFAETVWSEFLDPLYHDGTRTLEPLGEDGPERHTVDVEAAALQDAPFDTQHGLDSGTINPTQYKNGVVLDVAQAAMAAVPSDLELHRGRSIVKTVHTNDATAAFGAEDDDWRLLDEGYGRQRVLQAPRVSQYERTVVHELALYLAESHHALSNADVVDDILVLDGPVYPKGLLSWADREPELAELLDRDRPREVIENYVRLVERFIERDVPLVGFVKSPISRAVTRTVRETKGQAPWVSDAGFYAQVLDPTGHTNDDERPTDVLTCTNWFLSRGGADYPLSAEGSALGIERKLPAEAYEVTFFAVYDPRDDLIYRVEAPFAFTRDPERRDRLTRYVLGEVAGERGPPRVVRKADELARISRGETAALRDAIAEQFGADADTDYNDKRWDDGDGGGGGETWLGAM